MNLLTITPATDLPTLIILCIVLFAAWNGLVIKWYNTKDPYWSKWWHGIGLAIRIALVFIMYIVSGWLLAIIAAVLAGIVYNIIINLIIGKKWYYVGTTSVIDRWIRKILNIFKK